MGMDRSLLNCARQFTPPVEMDIVDGLAVKHMQHVEDFVESIFRTVAKDFPPGLEFIGGERCSPYEEFMNEPRVKTGGRPTVDIAQSDIYMMKYRFRFEGEELPPRYIFLPYVGEAGSLMLSGARFFISPVLADELLSYEKDKIFVVFMRDKKYIYRTNHSFVIDDQITELGVAWSILHNDPKTKTKGREKKIIPLIHYLLSKYGFTETFKKFGKCMAVMGKEDINPDAYPPEEWVIAKSRRFMPRPYNNGTDVRIAIPRAQYTPMVKSMLASFFYVADRFGERPIFEYKDNTRLWMTMLGLTLWGDSKDESVIYEEVINHFNSLDKYVDDFVRRQLQHIGHPCDNIYEFLAVCIEHMDQWMIETPKRSITLHDKKLSILYPVLLVPLIMPISRFYYVIEAEAQKNGLTKKSVTNILGETLKPRRIFKIRTDASNVSAMSYSGDNKFFKLTSVIKPQKGSGHGNDSKSDSGVRMHSSIAEVGSFLNLPKTDPTGHARVNPHLKLLAGEYVQRDPEVVALCDSVQHILDQTMRSAVVAGLEGDMSLEDIDVGDSDE